MSVLADRTIGRWPHRWALLTVFLATLQLVLGAFVTSFRAGMVDPVWPTAPWHLLLISWEEPRPGFLIEHTHRLTGYLVGLSTIGLAVSLWLGERRRGLRALALVGVLAMVGSMCLAFANLHHKEPGLSREEAAWCLGCVALCVAVVGSLLVGVLLRPEPGSWLRWLGMLALAGVIGQGLLGGLRVKLNALLGPSLAPAHGISAALVFTLLVGLHLFTKPGRWTAQQSHTSSGLRLWAVLTAALVLVQLVLGVLLRHTDAVGWLHGHLLGAVLVALAVAVLGQLVWSNAGRDRPTTRVVLLLAALVTVQLLLGVEAWMGKFSSGELPYAPVTVGAAVIRTAHTVLGDSILALAVAVMCLMWRRPPETTSLPTTSPAPLEGAA